MSMQGSMAWAAGGLVLAFGVGFSAPLQAQATDADRELISKVAAANLLEVRLGQTAQTQAESPAVKQFGQRMEADHSTMQKQWMGVAQKNRVEFKVKLSPQQLEQVYRLKDLTGSSFDREYMAAMVQNHEEDVNAFQNARNAFHSAEVRQLIDVALPALEEHLAQARQISRQVGGEMTATGAPVNDTSTVAAQPRQTTRSATNDSSFVETVSASNAAEIRLAELATSKAQELAVKRFAQRMITDHSRMQRDWSAVASRTGMPMIGTIGFQHQQQLARLERLSGREFDRAYMATMVQNHQETVNSFEHIGRSAQSSDLRELATRSLPELQEHLQLARQVADQVGADRTPIAAGAPGEQGNQANVRADKPFIRNVDAGNFLEIRLGELAQKRANSPAVKQFGRRMVEDHTRLQKQWTSMAARNGMPFQSGMGPNNRYKLQELEKLSGKRFDREYMTMVIQNRKDYLDYFRKEGRAAKSAPVRELVRREIPILERQMSHAKQIGGRVGADTIPSRYGRISATE